MIQIIPAIDIIEGKCVRLTQGDYAQKRIYRDDPTEIAQEFEAAGFSRLHLVDLDGAKEGAVKNWAVLESICTHTRLNVDFGGGIKTLEEAQRAFQIGAKQITIGSLAVKAPQRVQEWIGLFGPDAIILGADVRGAHIAVGGWLETSPVLLFDFIQNYRSLGVRNFLCTDISKDGMLNGPAFDLYKRILQHFPELNLIASGGVSSLGDLLRLSQDGIPAVVIGKAIFEEKISLADLAGLNNAS